MNFVNFLGFFPEIFLAFGIIFLLLVLNYFSTKINKNYFIAVDKVYILMTVFLVCLFLILFFSSLSTFAFGSLFILDSGIRFLKLFLVFVSLLVFQFIFLSFLFQKLGFFEIFILYLFALLSSLLIMSANDLFCVYLLIEIQAIAFYILASYKANMRQSAEAGMKYFIASGFMSGIFLFGISLIYGEYGTLCLLDLTRLNWFDSFFVYSPLNNFIDFIAFLFIGVSLLFKLGVAPLHFWAPDVYDASPLSATVIFAIIPKIALIFFFMKFILIMYSSYQNFSILVYLCGLSSIIVGIVFALIQKRVKLLIIFSSITQIGSIILILGDATNFHLNLKTALFFFFIYTLTSIVLWSFIFLYYINSYILQDYANRSYKQYQYFKYLKSPISKESYKVPEENLSIFYISNLKNLIHFKKLDFVLILIVFFSIAGIPPLSGFVAKFYILLDLVVANKLIGAFVFLVSSAISSYYYIRIIKVASFEQQALVIQKEVGFEDFEVQEFSAKKGLISFILNINWLFIFFFSYVFFNQAFLMSKCELIINHLHIF